MGKTLALLASSAFLGAAGLGVGFIGSGVASADVSSPLPVVNTPSCLGLATAAVAQNFISGGPGIGNVAKTYPGLPAGPKLIHDQTTGIAHYCATGIIGP